MKTFGLTLLVAIAGYLVGALVGVLLVQLFSTNQFDKAMEAGMVGAFFVGPIAALLSVIIFLITQFTRSKRTSD